VFVGFGLFLVGGSFEMIGQRCGRGLELLVEAFLVGSNLLVKLLFAVRFDGVIGDL